MLTARSFADLRKEHSFPKQRLTVNSIGELFRVDLQTDPMSVDPATYMSGSVNLGKMAEVLGHEPSEKELELEFDMQLRDFCDEEEYVFARRVWDLQKHNDSRFRIWGYIGVDDGRYTWLVTEFRALVIDKKMWRETIDLAHRLSGGVRNICKAPHCDHSYRNYGKPNQTEHFGPDHGKMERQVEMYWNITAWKDSEITTQRDEFAVRTQKLWDTYGIGVV